ncbi:hypothetical protein C493_07119 [Natronolimnohabitans innermongolicus JCM 12255]|uniref:Uncharacterized protein n=1 Tax=Natronolimnohabitans innermongolicus JCM 12255 TaxID=1227499 RepID=L9X9P2_9EURY|nr:hypothetical protein C493_07119 [Natronolimnohabitans innermongolicus JCM 12255]
MPIIIVIARFGLLDGNVSSTRRHFFVVFWISRDITIFKVFEFVCIYFFFCSLLIKFVITLLSFPGCEVVSILRNHIESLW